MRLVAGLAQVVADVFQPQSFVVAFDREDFPKHPFDSLVKTLLRIFIVLQKAFVTLGLNFRQVRNLVGSALAAEATDFLGTKTPFCRGGHGLLLCEFCELPANLASAVEGCAAAHADIDHRFCKN